MNDWDILASKFKAQRAQQAALDQYNRSLAKAQAEQNKPTGLAAVLNGIGQSIGNLGDSIYNMFGTGAASIRDLFTGNAGTGKYTNEWKQYRKEQMGDKDMSDKDYYLKTGGKALDAAATASDLIPGLGTGARIALNVGQGVASGVGQQFADRGSNVTEDDLIKAGLIGGASAGAGQLAGLKLGKAAIKNPATSKIGKALQSNVGRAALTGATAGATGGGLASALNGGSFIGGALEGAKSGALGGATIAGTMGLIGSGLNKVGQKAKLPTAQAVAEAPEATITKPVVPDTPEAPASTRRGIAVTDYDAGEQAVKVRRPNAPTGEYSLGKNAGSTLDGILGPNNPRKLPNAVAPTNDALIQKATGDTDVYNFVRNLADEGKDTLAALKSILSPEDYDAVLRNAREYAGIQADAFGGATNANSKSQLPQLNRQQYYEDTIGKLVSQGGDMRAADVPDYMESHLSNPKDMKERYVRGGNDEILRELFNDDESSISDLYQRYEELAQAANQNEIFTPENISKGLNLDNELAGRVGDAVLREYGLKQDVDVNAYPSLRKNVEVGFEGAPSDETIYTKRTLPARTEQNLPAKATPAQVAPISQETPQITHAERARLEREYTEARQRQGQTLLQQYGVLDAPTRRSVGDPAEVLSTLYDEYGLTNPAEVQYAANHVTGGDGAVSKITRKLASQAEKVDTRIQQGFLDDLMVNAGLSDEEAKTVTKQIVQSLRRAGNSGITDGNTALDIVKQIEGQIRQYKGENGTYHRMTDSESRKVNVLRNVKDEIQGRIWDAAGDPKKVIDTKTLNELKSMFDGNKKWENFVDNGIGKAQDGGELRHLMKPLVDGGKIVAGARMSAGSFADSIVDNARTASGKGLANAAFIAAKNKISNSPKAIQARADKYARQAANANAQLTGIAPVENATTKTGVKGAVKNIAAKAGEKIGNFGNKLNDDTFSSASYAGVLPTFGEVANAQIARQAGLGAANSENTKALRQAIAGELMDAQTQYQNAANTLASLPTASNTTSTGAQQLQTISSAMDRALAAGDITAYGQLADLYKKAYAIYGQETATPKALSATQSKALTAAQQLDQLAQMTPDAGTALASSPLGFLVDLGGGNQYANQAKALATTLGYLLSGANIRETEAERIGQAYVPSAFDSEPVRQQKLERARQLIQSYMGSTDDLTQA